MHSLPNSRAVSVALAGQDEKSDVSKTLALMEWSQFVSNDISYTPIRKMREYYFFFTNTFKFSS